MKTSTQQTILLTKPYKLYTMASIIKTSINLDSIDKTKIINGKKGKYLPIVITINDEVDQFGNQGPVILEQSKKQRRSI